MRGQLATLALAGALLVALSPKAFGQPDDRYAGVVKQSSSARGHYLHRDRHHRYRVARHHRYRGGASTSLGGVVGPLASKAHELQAACGSRVISSVRHTYIAGTGGRLSLHASGRAVDMAGNPGCMYSRLHGWPGGVSVDYGRVQHIHVSYAPGGPEWGLRFRHGGGRSHRRHHRRG